MNIDKLHNIRHSLAHLLAAAVLELYPSTKNTLGPAIDDGFYYDFDFITPISDKDLPKIEKKMREILKTWHGFEKEVVTEENAKFTFLGNEFKKELIEEITGKGEEITFYTSGKFTDLCRGGHVEDTKEINPDAFKLDRVAGAYWRGDEKNKMLTRIYGLAFSTKEELENYIAMREQARERDHKKLGRELDLFTFSELVGAGLPLFTPKGTLIRDLLDGFVWSLRKEAGYDRVDIPHITKKELYEKSGHWEKFQNDLFKINTREEHVFAMKPMNCPHHTQIYARKQWSYKELPQRYASTTKVYRDEQTGELSGLSRVRSITQDDAHVFCQMKDVEVEMEKIYKIVKTFYGSFGFTLTPRLSLHDPKNMSAYLGEEKTWLNAEKALRKIIDNSGEKAIEAVGEAAFYGPKIDFMAKDAIGREWQVATIQLDMNMPERFDLYCVNDEGQRERIVMIHAAIMGSIERFMSMLIEHTAGAFPAWLSPIQVAIVPVKEEHVEKAQELLEEMREYGIRVEIFGDNLSLGKRIHAAKADKTPYVIVLGEKEVSSGKLTIENRDGTKTEDISQKDFLKDLIEKISAKT